MAGLTLTDLIRDDNQQASQPETRWRAYREGGITHVVPVREPAPPQISTGEDVARSAVSGIDKGVAGLAGAPADLGRLAQYLVDQGQSKAGQYFPDLADPSIRGKTPDEITEQNTRKAVISPDTLKEYGGEAFHEASPLYHKPQTEAGQITEDATSFIPTALAPELALGRLSSLGQVGKTLATQAVIPAAISEAGGQWAKGTPMEPYVRAGGALVGGAVGGALNAPRAASDLVTDAARGATRAQVDEAERLFMQGQQMGVPITRAEALQHITSGGTGMGDLLHTVEGKGGLKDFFAQRPQQVAQTAEREFNQAMGAPAAEPQMVGPRVGAAAEDALTTERTNINRLTQPFYDNATRQTIPVGTFNMLRRMHPIFDGVVNEIRENPELGATVAHLPVNSVGVVDLAKRIMRERADALRSPTAQGGMSPTRAMNIEQETTYPVAVAQHATGTRPGVQAGSYEMATNINRSLRERFLEPLLRGPLGDLANKDISTQNAIAALFPAKPTNNAAAITQAVRQLALHNPDAARQLVRAHIQGVFNEATQRLASGGANQAGGAKFAAVLRGNPQQRANLEAAVTALRGHAAYEGLDRFLNTLEAMQQRAAMGSKTAFNVGRAENAATSGPLGTLGKAATITQIPSMITKKLNQWATGRNIDELSDLLTNPAAARLFRQYATAPPNSAAALAHAVRLIAMTGQSTR